MKSTGVVRKVDELGRVVLPVEIRKVLDIKEKDAVEIFTESDTIVLRKYAPSCIFCSNVDNVVYFKGKRICAECLQNIKEQI
jgi:transcriptional pleiotropic regulator of transition state genes